MPILNDQQTGLRHKPISRQKQQDSPLETQFYQLINTFKIVISPIHKQLYPQPLRLMYMVKFLWL